MVWIHEYIIWPRLFIVWMGVGVGVGVLGALALMTSMCFARNIHFSMKFLSPSAWEKWERTSSGIISRNLTSCDRDTLAVRWYSTSSLRELNFTTQRKNLLWASRRTLKCWTPSGHLQDTEVEILVRVIDYILMTYLTDKEKSPGLDSLMRIKKAPSCLFDNSFSASARVMRP